MTTSQIYMHEAGWGDVEIRISEGGLEITAKVTREALLEALRKDLYLEVKE